MYKKRDSKYSKLILCAALKVGLLNYKATIND